MRDLDLGERLHVYGQGSNVDGHDTHGLCRIQRRRCASWSNSDANYKEQLSCSLIDIADHLEAAELLCNGLSHHQRAAELLWIDIADHLEAAELLCNSLAERQERSAAALDPYRRPSGSSCAAATVHSIDPEQLSCSSNGTIPPQLRRSTAAAESSPRSRSAPARR